MNNLPTEYTCVFHRCYCNIKSKNANSSFYIEPSFFVFFFYPLVVLCLCCTGYRQQTPYPYIYSFPTPYHPLQTTRPMKIKQSMTCPHIIMTPPSSTLYWITIHVHGSTTMISDLFCRLPGRLLHTLYRRAWTYRWLSACWNTWFGSGRGKEAKFLAFQ